MSQRRLWSLEVEAEVEANADVEKSFEGRATDAETDANITIKGRFSEERKIRGKWN